MAVLPSIRGRDRPEYQEHIRAFQRAVLVHRMQEKDRGKPAAAWQSKETGVERLET